MQKALVYTYELLFTYFQIPLLVTLFAIVITLIFTKPKLFGDAYKNVLIIFCVNSIITLAALLMNYLKGLPSQYFIDFISFTTPRWHYLYAAPQIIAIVILPFLGFLPLFRGKYLFLAFVSVLQNYPWIIETFLMNHINFPDTLLRTLPRQNNFYVVSLGLGYFLVFIFFKKSSSKPQHQADDVLDA